jgi:hypothetical protein
MPDTLVSWGLIMNRYTGFPLHCHLQTGSGPIRTLLLHEAQHLPEFSAKNKWVNPKDSSLWEITPWRVKPNTFVLELTHILNGPVKTKNYGWWTSFEYMLVLPIQLLHHTLNRNIGWLLTLVLNEGEIWFKILKSYVLPSGNTVHMLCTTVPCPSTNTGSSYNMAVRSGPVLVAMPRFLHCTENSHGKMSTTCIRWRQ